MKDFVILAAGLLALYAVFLASKIAALGWRCKQTPKPGEQWAFTEKQGPWASAEYPPVTVLDVRDGWVRYDMTTFKDQRMKVDFFTRLYRPVKP